MRNFVQHTLCGSLIVLALLPLVACIESAPGGGGGQQQQILVTVTSTTPLPASIPVSTTTQPSTIQFGATLVGTSNQAVTWNPPTLSSNSTSSASGDALGTIDANGLYTAPQTIPSCPTGTTSPCELQIVISATAQANTSFSGQAIVNVHVIVGISPNQNIVMGQGANLQFTATVTGTTDQTVNWSPACTSCASGQGAGTFDPNNVGLYFAPPLEEGAPSGQIISVSATSSFDTTQVASANVTVNLTDPLGTSSPSSKSSAEIPCPSGIGGLSGATCYQVNTVCSGVADYSVYLKVNTPPGTPIGTVIFGTGSGGSALYDNDSPDFFYVDSSGNSVNGGLAVVQGILDAGYTTVQVSFGSPFNNAAGAVNGWLQGPGGVRRLACRYATVAQWVYQNIHNSNASAPFCATGNSGGSGAIGYAVFNYGVIFNMVEPTSGPVMTTIDQGCSPSGTYNYEGTTACTNPAPSTNLSYSPGADGTASIIDTAYQNVGSSTPTLCTDAINGVNPNNFNRFESDSIDYAPSKSPAIPISNTVINLVFGSQDTSNAVPQGEVFWSSVGPRPTQACADAPHAIPASSGGVSQIVNDITGLCVLP